MNTSNQCSPSAQNRKTNSCFTYQLLLLIAKLYNNSHDDVINLNQKLTRQKLWNELNKRISQCNSNEACWLEQPFVVESKRIVLENRFKPKQPESWKRNPNEWLNTFDIWDVMKQYEEKDKSYRFVGVYPIDFASKGHDGVCVVQEMCQLDIAKEWRQGKKRLGVVFNTDKSTGSGEHWISLFIGLDPKRRNFGIFFYDSVAMRPPKEVSRFMTQLKKEIIALHPKHASSIEVLSNKHRRQYKNFNCGVFSVLFQILILNHRFEDVCLNMGYDDDVQQFRSILYRS